MTDVFVARQPIFDRDRKLVGYELLHRSSGTALDSGDSTTEMTPSEMTGSMMVDSLLGIGLDQLTGKVPAWINFSREPLLRHDFELLDPKKCVIELSETVECDVETTLACQRLTAKGFTLALDDFVADVTQYAPILIRARIVKLSLLGESGQQIRDHVARLARFKVRLLAEKVEDRAMYELCRELGFSLFQGYYFSRPETVQRKDLPGQMAHIARLMRFAMDGVSRDGDLEREFRADPGLSLKLLKIVNSAAAGGNGIESIRHAIRMVGREQLYRWLALLFGSAAPRGDDVRAELLLQAVERGRFCELLAERSGKQSVSGSLFLTGLLAGFDAILGISMPELLQQMRLTAEVEAALLHRSGPHAPYVELATNYADGSWGDVLDLGTRMGLTSHLAPCYSEASAWARDLLSQN